MMRATCYAAGLMLLAAAADAQVTYEPIAEGYAGLDLSYDGNAMAGNWVAAATFETFRWTRAGGIEHLGRDTSSFANGAGTPDISYDGTKISALNGHCGMWMFVKGGEKVAKGQLLGQMGLSFSAENGGHGANDSCRPSRSVDFD